MEHDTNPVRRVQQHLRRAAAFVAEQDFDAASREVAAVLTLDPASLPALAMNERIEAARARAVAAPRAVPAPRTSAPRLSGAAFVPSGVDAQSWIGFEARIQERRYRALTETIRTAIANGNGLRARAALEEARELRPEATELEALATRVALLPVSMPAAAMSASIWSRAFGAVALLLVGVAFLVGIDWLRSSAEPPSQAPVTAAAPQPVNSPDLQVATPAGPVAAASSSAAVPATPTPTPPVTTAREPQAVGTVGLKRVATVEESGAAGAARATFQAAAGRHVAIPADGEIPDDYVAAPPPRRETGIVPATPSPAPAPAPAAASPAAPYASVIRQPTPIVTSSLVAPPTAAPAAAVSTPADEAQVQQVLRRYARAYGALDATAAHAVWPSVDERALARAFSGLVSQNVSFDSCDINVAGATANASCRGRASYVAKIGSREPRSEARTWTFELRRNSDGWTIENAEARRAAEN